MASMFFSKIRYRFHRHCAACYESRLFDRAAGAHEEKARRIDETVLHGDNRLPAWMDRALHACCRVLVGLDYAVVLASGRLDEPH